MTTSIGSEVSDKGLRVNNETQREPVVACHDLWKSCWVQSEQYKKYQPVYSAATRLPRMDTPFNPSNFQPASVFLRSSSASVTTGTSVQINKVCSGTGVLPSTNVPSLTNETTAFKRSRSQITSFNEKNNFSSDNLDEFDQSYESELRRNAPISLGLKCRHSSTPSLNRAMPVSTYQSSLVYTTQYRPPNSTSSVCSNKYQNDSKRLDYLKQHLLMNSKISDNKNNENNIEFVTCSSTMSTSATTSTTNIYGTSLQFPSVGQIQSRLTTEAQTFNPQKYATLQPKSRSKPRPLRSGTLQRHKSSAEIYSKNSPIQSSSLNRLLSISAEDIRRSLKETNGVLQRLLGNGRKKAAVKSIVEDTISIDFSCRQLEG